MVIELGMLSLQQQVRLCLCHKKGTRDTLLIHMPFFPFPSSLPSIPLPPSLLPSLPPSSPLGCHISVWKVMVGGMFGKSLGKARRALKKPPAQEGRREGREGRMEGDRWRERKGRHKTIYMTYVPSYSVSAGPTKSSSHSKRLSSTRPTETPSGGFLFSSVPGEGGREGGRMRRCRVKEK